MTLSHLLDTNAVIAVVKDPSGTVARRMRQQASATVGTSAIVLHELYFGAFNSARIDRNLAQLEQVALTVVSFDQADAREAGRVRARLAAAGMPIGPIDVLIAGQALARRLTVVTANRREFQRVPGLATEDWSVP